MFGCLGDGWVLRDALSSTVTSATFVTAHALTPCASSLVGHVSCVVSHVPCHLWAWCAEPHTRPRGACRASRTENAAARVLQRALSTRRWPPCTTRQAPRVLHTCVTCQTPCTEHSVHQEPPASSPVVGHRALSPTCPAPCARTACRARRIPHASSAAAPTLRDRGPRREREVPALAPSLTEWRRVINKEVNTQPGLLISF